MGKGTGGVGLPHRALDRKGCCRVTNYFHVTLLILSYNRNCALNIRLPLVKQESTLVY